MLSHALPIFPPIWLARSSTRVHHVGMVQTRKTVVVVVGEGGVKTKK